jgi:hypothetical protein
MTTARFSRHLEPANGAKSSAGAGSSAPGHTRASDALFGSNHRSPTPLEVGTAARAALRDGRAAARGGLRAAPALGPRGGAGGLRGPRCEGSQHRESLS